MSEVNYNERTWLNDTDSHFTGSMVCFDGVNIINQLKLLERYSFVEIASCHGKCRIHSDANSSMDTFIDKLRLMRGELDRFIDHLEKSERQKRLEVISGTR